ncbi:hypothetical protein BOV91_10870, partial [Solemya velum gill symbiont]
MNKRLTAAQLILVITILVASQSLAAKEKGYPAIPLLSTETTIVGESIAYPTTGQAKVTAAIVTLAPGEKTILHKHGVPLFAYILDGELSVDYGNDGIRIYKQGDAFMEAMSVSHFGENNTSQP